MNALDLIVQMAVRDCHAYKNDCTTAIGEELVHHHEWYNDHDKHAVVVHGEEEHLGTTAM